MLSFAAISPFPLSGTDDLALIAIVDGLKGFPDAINNVFPETQIQTCDASESLTRDIVHLIRNSLEFAPWKDRKAIAAELKKIYRAIDAEAAQQALSDLEDSAFGQKYAAVTAMWRRNWEQVIPFFAYPQEVRKMIYAPEEIPLGDRPMRSKV
jgi:putative transposase